MSNLWERIDLHRHGVIEAHAGTGKTYTIVRLVLRILETPVAHDDGRVQPVHIRDILLVTFTEKAAGELKKRIRDGLEQRIATLQQHHPLRKHLENCLTTMHEALIGTIHAVCLRLLQTWPFESGVHFDTEIVDDRESIEAALRVSIRTDWQDEASALPWALTMLADEGITLQQRHFDLIKDSAVQLLDDQFTMLDRSAASNQTLSSIKQQLAKVSVEIQEHEARYRPLLVNLIASLKTVAASGLLQPDRLDIVNKRLPELQAMADSRVYTLSIVRKPCHQKNKGIYTAADVKKHASVAVVARHCTACTEHPFVALLERQSELKEALLLALVTDAAELLAKRWKQTKRDEGYLSYQDMLQCMYRAVCERPVFADALRKRLQYAIIDEFQDTSRIQWNIFRALILDADTDRVPRLYIVGDPKQSIYMFQGADVQSYIEAKRALCGDNGTPYTLTCNYRSLESTINGYNLIFATSATKGTLPDKQNWFLFDGEENGITYTAETAVVAPQRSTAAHTQPCGALQVIALEGSKTARIKKLAEQTTVAIAGLVGTVLSVPDGLSWREIQLDYEDFAVIVETHTLAEPFLELFKKRGIPAVKYKMEGVFQSPMATALHALCCAISAPPGDLAPLLAALLTPFFNRRPQDVDAGRDLEPCGRERCEGNELCIAHALILWRGLAAKGYWSQLFGTIIERTGIARRLLCLVDGERHLADIRQITDYCMEKLYREHFTFSRLTEHLGNLLKRKEHAGLDRNLHVLETERSSVKVLTMHASKGLEFPVVFVVTAGSRSTGRGAGYLRYSPERTSGGNGNPAIAIAPYLSSENIKGGRAKELFMLQASQERRRLLYVALTRAQALLFVPMHLDYGASDGTVTNQKLPSKGADNDLTPALQRLLATGDDTGEIVLFNSDAFTRKTGETIRSGTGEKSNEDTSAAPDIAALDLLSRVCRQTSYSKLTREVVTYRDIDRSDEADVNVIGMMAHTPSKLPGGRLTGDALHCALEELLMQEDRTGMYGEEHQLREVVARYLVRNGVVARSNSETLLADGAVTVAGRCVQGALTTTITLPGGGTLSGIGSLDKSNIIPEMEFLLEVENSWVHGYMDVVFRTPNPDNSNHPWRYFVLDWKSDTLAAYTDNHLAECIRLRHYDLQAKLYSCALDRYLHGVLGSVYSAADHLGGALYLFLREHEHGLVEHASVWSHKAVPSADWEYVLKIVTAPPVLSIHGESTRR